MNLRDLRLQPLRIPEGWTVIINKFYDLEPHGELEIQGLPGNKGWLLFEEELLLLVNRDMKKHLLLGWFPYYSPDGCFCVELYRSKDLINPIREFTTKEKREIVDKINEWLMNVSMGKVS